MIGMFVNSLPLKQEILKLQHGLEDFIVLVW